MALTKEQREARALTIGGSDIPKIAGLSKYAGPLSVYREKVEGFDFGDSEAAEIGSEAEPLIARLYEKRTGKTLELCTTITHPKYRWATANLDRITDGGTLPVELKNVGFYAMEAWDEDEEDGVPDDYRAQVTWQVGLLRALGVDAREAHVAALLAGNRFRIFRVPFDQGFFDDLLIVAWSFVSKHLRERVPPPLDGTEESRAFLRARFPEELRPMLEAPIQSIAWAEELHELTERKKATEARIEELKTLFQATIEDAAGLLGPDGAWKATWTKNANGNPSWKGVAEALRAKVEELESDRESKAGQAKERTAKLFDELVEITRGEAPRVFRFSYGTKKKKKGKA